MKLEKPFKLICKRVTSVLLQSITNILLINLQKEFWQFFLFQSYLTASSHLVSQAKRPNPKLFSRGEDKSPLKYIFSVLLSNFEYFIEKKFGLSIRVWVFVLGGPKLLSRGQTLGAKSAKKCYHISTLEAFHLWSLATSVKAQRSTSRLSTNHVVGFPSPLKLTSQV